MKYIEAQISLNPITRFNSFTDTQKHLTTSTAIAWPVTIFAYKTIAHESQWKSALIGYLATVSIGGGKELIHDKIMHRGTPSWSDMLNNCIGGLYGVTAAIMCEGVQNHEKEKKEYHAFLASCINPNL